MIKFREVGIAIEVKRSDAGDVLPVAMFLGHPVYMLMYYPNIFQARVQ